MLVSLQLREEGPASQSKILGTFFKRYHRKTYIGRGQRRHRDKGTGSIPDIFLILLDMKKLSSANQRGCNKHQSCQKLLNLVEK